MCHVYNNLTTHEGVMTTQIELAKQAVELVKPSINALLQGDLTNREVIHIVMMNPKLKPWESEFEDAILYEESIGDFSTYNIPFRDLARNKAKQAWREQQSNINLKIHPSSLQDDDCPFYGSFVYGNIVVSCSGVQQWFDMLVAGWIALAFEQLSIHQQEQNNN